MSEIALPSDVPAPAPGAGAAIARNAFHLVVGQALTTAMSIALSGALGRSLDASDFGVFFLVGSMTGFAYVVVEWGQSAHVIREIARHPERVGDLLGSALVLRIAAAAALILPTMFTGWLLQYDGRTRVFSVVMMVTYLPLVLSQAYSLVFRARERMELDAIVTVVAKALTLGLTIPALWLGGRLLSVYVAQGVAGLGAMALAALLLRRLRLPRLRVTRESMRDVLRGGASVLVMNLGIAIQAYLDTIIFSKLAPHAAIGWYGAARILMNGLILPAPIIASAAYPRLSRVSHDPQLFHAEVRTALRPLLALGALAAVGTFLFADLAVGMVYGATRFRPTVAILQVFAPGMLFFFVSALLASVVLAAGRSRQLAVAKLISVAVSAGLDFVFIPWTQARYGNGGIGVVLAFGTAEVVVLFAAIAILPSGTLGSDLLGDVGRAVVAGGATLLVFRAVPLMSSPALGIPGCILLFALFATAVGLVSRSELTSGVVLLRRRLGLEASRK